MIDFEHAQAFAHRAIGESVEACTQKHILADAARHGFGQAILGEAAPRGDESAQPVGRGHGADVAALAQLGFRFLTDDLERQRIVEDRRAVDKLMRGAVHGGALGRATRLVLFHGSVGASWAERF